MLLVNISDGGDGQNKIRVMKNMITKYKKSYKKVSMELIN